MSFQNRMIIPAANGLITLSIPLKGGRENKELLKEVLIDNSQRWQARHWRTITSAYRRSPWFEFYEPSLQPLYHREYKLLHEWNLDILRWIISQLKVEIDLKLALEQKVVETAEDKQDERYMKPANYQDRLFCNQLPVYAQVFQDRLGFQSNVSIADLIFNEGNKSRSLLV